MCGDPGDGLRFAVDRCRKLLVVLRKATEARPLETNSSKLSRYPALKHVFCIGYEQSREKGQIPSARLKSS